VSYFNLCGEKAAQQVSQPVPMSDFRNQLMNQLSTLLEEENWWKDIKGEIK
jgi:hydroxyethylthiazole kinase-like sugar kinase family protein